MNVITMLWAETIALFLVFSAFRGMRGMMRDGDGFFEGFWNGIVRQAKWHVTNPLGWVADVYLLILAIATLIGHFFG